jgi:hypothetical protein
MLTFSSAKSGWGGMCYMRSARPSSIIAMHNSDYYREEAAKYRELAEIAKDAAPRRFRQGLRMASSRPAIAAIMQVLRYPRRL